MIYALFFLILFFLLFVSGILSGSETAMTGASKAQLFQLAKKGNKKAEQVYNLQENLSNSVSSILVATNFVNYVIPSISVWFASTYMDTKTAAVFTILLPVITSIYVEIFPKMLAICNMAGFAMFVVGFISYLIKVLKPFVSVLEMIARCSLRMCGVNVTDSTSPMASEEELRGAIELHSDDTDKEGVEKKCMLKSILDLAENTVDSVMIHRKNLVTINVDLPISEIMEEVLKIPYSRIPLWKDNHENIVGILRTRTFLLEAQRVGNDKLETIDIKKMMSRPWFIPETTDLLEQLQEFRKRCEHFALVVDEYGDLMGSVTLEDILEEIVGEIVDEYDTTQSSIALQPDRSLIVEGKTPVRDLNRQFGWSLPEEDATTIAGLLMNEARKIPDVGEIYILYSFKIEVLKRQRNQITLVRITNLHHKNDSDGIAGL